jgi:hypothetical protein
MVCLIVTVFTLFYLPPSFIFSTSSYFFCLISIHSIVTDFLQLHIPALTFGAKPEKFPNSLCVVFEVDRSQYADLRTTISSNALTTRRLVVLFS